MTPEQFVFWLSGFLSGINYDCNVKHMNELLEEMLKKVINPHLQNVGFFYAD